MRPTRMSVGSAPRSGSTGTTFCAQSRPMLVRRWQMRVPSGSGTHQGPTCHGTTQPRSDKPQSSTAKHLPGPDTLVAYESKGSHYRPS